MSLLIELFQQVADAADQEPKPERFNPRPAGVIQPGSATEAVLKVLLESGGLMTESQLIWKTKRSHSAVSWALLRLRKREQIEAFPNIKQSSRCLRYRAKR